VTDLFRSLSGGLARFVLGWIIPSAVAVGLFVLVAGRDLVQQWPTLKGRVPGSSTGLVGAGVFTLAVLSLAVLFAYASLPIYRLLEGYTLPRPLARRYLRGQMRQWRQLQTLARRPELGHLQELSLERLQNYPATRAQLLPTRLGNAYRALETYGSSRYSLDSQTLWYELQSVIPPQLRRDVEDGRASVDFFVSSVVHCVLLVVVCALTVATTRTHSVGAGVLGIAAAALIRPAYNAAVRNMTDYRFSVQAAVNLGRGPLANSLGLRLPASMQQEIALWDVVTEFVAEGKSVDRLRYLNGHRSSDPG